MFTDEIELSLPKVIDYRGVQQKRLYPFPLPTDPFDGTPKVYRWTAGPVGSGQKGPIRTTFSVSEGWTVYWHDHQGVGPTLEAAQAGCDAACVISAKRQLLFGLPEADRL